MLWYVQLKTMGAIKYLHTSLVSESDYNKPISDK